MALLQYDFKNAFQAVIDWAKGKFVTHESRIEVAIGGVSELGQMIVDDIEPRLMPPTTNRSDDYGFWSGADRSKLDGIEAGAQKNTVTSVNGKTGAVTVTEGITRSTADSLYLTKTSAQSTYQPKGDYVTATQLSQKGYADAAALANKQDKIKIVSKAPETSSTSGDPDGTIYLVV